jgi:hypothetical protein
MAITPAIAPSPPPHSIRAHLESLNCPLCTLPCLPHPPHRRRHREARPPRHYQTSGAPRRWRPLLRAPCASHHRTCRLLKDLAPRVPSFPRRIEPPPEHPTTPAGVNLCCTILVARSFTQPSSCGEQHAPARFLASRARNTSRHSPARQRPPRRLWRPDHRPNRPLKPLARFASSSSSHRIKPRCIWWPGAHFRASSGKTPPSSRRLHRAPPPSGMPAATPSRVHDASRPIHRGWHRLNRGITPLAQSTMD